MNTSRENKKNVSTKKIFETLENEGTEFKELTSGRRYIKFDEFAEGETRPYVYMGPTSFNKDGEEKPAVILMDKSEEEFICASTIVVRALMKVENFPVGCKIMIEGKETGPNGNYFKARVFVL